MVKRNSYDGGGRGNKRRKSNDGRGIERNTTTKTEGCSVFVGNLKYETKWQALKDHMRKAGNVDSANILEAPNGRSKGCALVTYQHPKEAQRAIRELNESELEGRTIFVQPDNGKPNSNNNSNSNNNGSPQQQQYSVFVGNLPYECSWQALKDFFKSCGYIERAEVMEDPATGRKKGFGIVTFSNERAMENAIRKFHGSDFQGRTLEVRPDKKSGNSNNRDSRSSNGKSDGNSNSKPPTPNSKQLYVGNLSYDCTWQNLKDAFKRFGTVSHAEVCETAKGRTTGFGIVAFAKPNSAQQALSAMNGTEFQGRKLSVKWDKSPEKLESEKVGNKKQQQQPRDNNNKKRDRPPAKSTKNDSSMQQEDNEPKGDPLDMALSAPR